MCAFSILFVSTSLNLLAWIKKCLNNKLQIKSGNYDKETQVNNTINLEIFAEVYYHETKRIRSFMKIKPQETAKLFFPLLLRYIMPKSQIFNVANMSVYDIRQNKILT